MLRWLSDPKHKFNVTYTRSRESVIPLYEDRALAAATGAVQGVVKTKKQVLDRFGNIVDVEEERIGDNVERAKLMLSGYTWALGWLSPRRHGHNASPDAGRPNEQLQALFDSLKQGPVDG